MYTRESSSWSIADDMMIEGSARGHTVIDCAYRQSINSYLAAHGSASTLGGWIATVKEYPDMSCQYAMAFMAVHKYLADKFPQDVVEEFLEIGVRDPWSNALIAFTMGGKLLLPEHIERELLDIPPEILTILEDPNNHWIELLGDY